MLLKRIIWSIDPFFDNPLLQRKTVKVLRAITEGISVNIEPVFIEAPDIFNLSEAAQKHVGTQVMFTASERLTKFLQTINLPGLMPPKGLTQEEYSVRGAVKTLLSHARETDCDLICVSTTAKKGVARLFLGSFAESLLMQSEIPSLIVGPGSHIQKTISEIVFPSDFSPASQEAFEHMLDLAETTGARVTFFHKVENPPAYYSPFFPVPLDPQYVQTHSQQRRTQAEGWAAIARSRGVTVNVVIDDTAGDVVSGIIAAAKKMDSGVIAMASQTGPIASVILGSVTRKVVRQSPCPVWTIHPANRAEQEHKPEKAA